MEKKSNWKEFKEILYQNDIHSLYHFTDRSNLESIIKNGGLYSWKDCEKKGIIIPKPGSGGLGSLSWSLDSMQGLEHYVRVSFTKQHPMMYAALNEGRISDYVILEIDPDVIFWRGTKYADMNATKNGASIGETIDNFKKIHFNTVKEVNQFVLFPDEQPFYQAEVLVKNYIPLEYIKNIGDFGIPLPTLSSTSKGKVLSEEIPDKPISPAEIVSKLWEQGRFGEAISISASGFVPSTNSQCYIENFIKNHNAGNNYKYELNINSRTFKCLHKNGSYLTVVGNNKKYYVTVSDGLFKGSHAYLEKDFEQLLYQKQFPSDLIKGIGLLCQQNYEERMAMGVIIQVLAHAEPMTAKFSQVVDSVMKGYLYLPDDFDTQICFFTPQQIDNIINNMTAEKKRYLFILMSKVNISSIENYQSGDIFKVLSSKRFLIIPEIVKKYNLPQK